MRKAANKAAISVSALPALFPVGFLRCKKLAVIRTVIIVKLVSPQLSSWTAENTVAVSM